jgi:hypothetical protein
MQMNHANVLIVKNKIFLYKQKVNEFRLSCFYFIDNEKIKKRQEGKKVEEM